MNPRQVSPIPSAGTEVTFVPMAAVDELEGRIARPQLRAYTEVAKGYVPFRDGDVLFAKITPCMQNGKAAVALNLRNGLGFGSTEFHVIRPESEIMAKWVFLFMRQASFRAAAEASFTGTAGQQRVPAAFISSARIPVPPLPEQERIVRLLDAAEELRRLRAAADRRTADLIPALFNDMFGDLSRNAHGSPIIPFSELAQGFRYGTSTKSTVVGKPTLRIPNVIGNTLQLDDLKFVSISEEEYEAWRLRDGDLVFVRTNGNADFIGRSAVFDSKEISEAGHDPTEFIYASYLIRARLFLDKIEPHYLQQYLRSKDARAEVRKRARTSAGQYNINTVSLGSIPILVPPLSLQRQFAARVTEIRALETQQAASRRRLDGLFQSMLHRAFRGEL